MGRKSAPIEPEQPTVDHARRRKDLARRMRLSTPEWVRETIPLERAEEYGLGDLWREVTGEG